MRLVLKQVLRIKILVVVVLAHRTHGHHRQRGLRLRGPGLFRPPQPRLVSLQQVPSNNIFISDVVVDLFINLATFRSFCEFYKTDS